MSLAGYSLSDARVNVDVEISGREGKHRKFGTEVTWQRRGLVAPSDRPHLPPKFFKIVFTLQHDIS